jgi:hypothetical protein
MQPNPLRYRSKYDGKFGEVNEDNKLHGRSIHIWDDGDIRIGYYEDGNLSTGNYIHLLSDGVFFVGEFYMEEGLRKRRGTEYQTDGTEKKYDE